MAGGVALAKEVLMERMCRHCGRVYRGLVCQACHPRKVKTEVEAEVKAEEELRVTSELTDETRVTRIKDARF